jgi:DNA-binding transcriptional LysR family regulator
LVTTEATSSALGVLLASGGLDCAVVNLPLANPDLRVEPLFDEDIVLLLAEAHPLSREEKVHIADLEGVELILPAPHTGFREELDEAARHAGTMLSSKADIDGLRLLAALTLRGYGPALVPATTVPELPEGFRTISVDGLPLRHVGMALRKRGRPSAPTQALIAVIQDVVSANLSSERHLYKAGA